MVVNWGLLVKIHDDFVMSYKKRVKTGSLHSQILFNRCVDYFLATLTV